MRVYALLCVACVLHACAVLCMHVCVVRVCNHEVMCAAAMGNNVWCSVCVWHMCMCGNKVMNIISTVLCLCA